MIYEDCMLCECVNRVLFVYEYVDLFVNVYCFFFEFVIDFFILLL